MYVHERPEKCHNNCDYCFAGATSFVRLNENDFTPCQYHKNEFVFAQTMHAGMSSRKINAFCFLLSENKYVPKQHFSFGKVWLLRGFCRSCICTNWGVVFED